MQALMTSPTVARLSKAPASRHASESLGYQTAGVNFPLTPALSLGEREPVRRPAGTASALPCLNVEACIPKPVVTVATHPKTKAGSIALPSPRGEGQGEGNPRRQPFNGVRSSKSAGEPDALQTLARPMPGLEPREAFGVRGACSRFRWILNARLSSHRWHHSILTSLPKAPASRQASESLGYQTAGVNFPLTPALSLGEREHVRRPSGTASALPCLNVEACIPKPVVTVATHPTTKAGSIAVPSPRGEGQGEGNPRRQPFNGVRSSKSAGEPDALQTLARLMPGLEPREAFGVRGACSRFRWILNARLSSHRWQHSIDTSLPKAPASRQASESLRGRTAGVTFPLTPALSLGEREPVRRPSGTASALPCLNVEACIPKPVVTVATHPKTKAGSIAVPSPRGEGQGEGNPRRQPFNGVRSSKSAGKPDALQTLARLMPGLEPREAFGVRGACSRFRWILNARLSNHRWQHSIDTSLPKAPASRHASESLGYQTAGVNFPLTPALSLGEREPVRRPSEMGNLLACFVADGCDPMPAVTAATSPNAKQVPKAVPSPRGEGQGEGNPRRQPLNGARSSRNRQTLGILRLSRTHSKRWRDLCRVSNLAKRLECGELASGLARARRSLALPELYNRHRFSDYHP